MTEDKRAVVVIGGTSGIGKAIALRFLKAGCRVVVSGRDAGRGEAVAREGTGLGGEGVFRPVDLADAASVHALARWSAERFGAPEVFVNSGGLRQNGTAVLDMPLEENDRIWQVNYRGALIACQAFGAATKAAGRGAILNIASIASFAPLSLPAYTPGKAAMRSLTEILAAELGPHGVRVNGVAPGFTLSDGLKERIAKGLRNPDAIKATTALREFVLPEQIAEAAYFLCSESAGAITGVTLPIDCGWLVQAPYMSYMAGNPIKPRS
jgi:NAD(P)-dependent dehydrogenase (short-subunit alcohol dehydrogenase family)